MIRSFFSSPSFRHSLLLIGLSLSLLLAVLAIRKSPPGVKYTPQVRAVVSEASSIVYLPIEKIRVGDRVVTTSIKPSEIELSRVEKVNDTEVEASMYRLVKMRSKHSIPDGTLTNMEIETLQPVAWLERNQILIGKSIPMPVDLTDMGVPENQEAIVTSIGPCPPISSGHGRVILTTVNHISSTVHELVVTDSHGHQELIRPTASHKFYSATRGGWLSAELLTKGELLDGELGKVVVSKNSAISGTHRVYNFTVEHDHVYRVGLSGVLVHNMDCWPFAEQAQATLGGDRILIRPAPTASGHVPPGILRPPGYPSGPPMDHHAVHLLDGVVRDPMFPGGIPYREWMERWANMWRLTVDEIRDSHLFTTILPGDTQPIHH